MTNKMKYKITSTTSALAPKGIVFGVVWGLLGGSFEGSFGILLVVLLGVVLGFLGDSWLTLG